MFKPKKGKLIIKRWSTSSEAEEFSFEELESDGFSYDDHFFVVYLRGAREPHEPESVKAYHISEVAGFTFEREGSETDERAVDMSKWLPNSAPNSSQMKLVS